MTVQETFELAMRWTHAIATLLWIGGSLFYVLVIRAVQQRLDPPWGTRLNQTLAQEFRSWINLSIGVLVVSGAVLTLMRLASDSATLPYVIVLGVKISLAMVIFLLLRSQRRRRISSPLVPEGSSPAPATPHTVSSPWSRLRPLFSGVNLVVILGILVFLLADVLRLLFERSLQGG